MRTQTAKPGFTMVELLVVVLILAILITVIIGVSHAVVARGKAETTRKNMQLVLEGIDAFAETDASRVWPVERTDFPTMNNAQGNRGTPIPSDFDWSLYLPNDVNSLANNGNLNWMAFIRAKFLSLQLIGGSETVAGALTQYLGNAAAKVKVGNAPTALFPFSFTDTDTKPHIGSQALFIDAYGKYMDYSSSRGAGSAPVLISAGADGKFGTEDDIRSDRR